MSFFDARCTKCGARIGWTGKLSDKPPCYKCGHHDVCTSDDDKYIEEMEQLLRKKMLGDHGVTLSKLMEKKDGTGIERGTDESDRQKLPKSSGEGGIESA